MRSDQRRLGHCHMQLQVTGVDTNKQSYHYLLLEKLIIHVSQNLAFKFYQPGTLGGTRGAQPSSRNP